jgi:hypothetical protein
VPCATGDARPCALTRAVRGVSQRHAVALAGRDDDIVWAERGASWFHAVTLIERADAFVSDVPAILGQPLCRAQPGTARPCDATRAKGGASQCSQAHPRRIMAASFLMCQPSLDDLSAVYGRALPGHAGWLETSAA